MGSGSTSHFDLDHVVVSHYRSTAETTAPGSPKDTPISTARSPSTGVVAGSAVGAVLLLAFLAVALWWRRRRRARFANSRYPNILSSPVDEVSRVPIAT
jgi:LPXTG-motif cell wall-anchored protein